MTKTQAEREAKKRWGKSAEVSMHDLSSSPERREKAKSALDASRAEIAAIDAEIKRRLLELDWYQELTARARKLRKLRDESESLALYQRFHVGTRDHMFMFVRGSGDTFEEAFAEADRRENG